jgi:hypothetical protein
LPFRLFQLVLTRQGVHLSGTRELGVHLFAFQPFDGEQELFLVFFEFLRLLVDVFQRDAFLFKLLY